MRLPGPNLLGCEMLLHKSCVCSLRIQTEVYNIVVRVCPPDLNPLADYTRVD